MPKAVKVATRYCRDLALAVLPSLRSIFMDVAGFVRKSKDGGASAASATEATQTLITLDSLREKDDGELDTAGFLGSAYLAPAMMPRPTPRPRVRRRRHNVRNLLRRLRAFLDPPTPKAKAPVTTAAKARGKTDRRTPRKSQLVRVPNPQNASGTGNKGPPPPAPAKPAHASAKGSKFARDPPKEQPSAPTKFMREPPAKKPDAEKVKRDFNHPKPPWMR